MENHLYTIFGSFKVATAGPHILAVSKTWYVSMRTTAQRQKHEVENSEYR